MSKNNLLDGNWVLANFRASSSASYCPRARNKHQNWKLIFCLFVILTIKWLNISNRHRTTPYLLWSYLDIFSVLYTSLLWTCLKYLSFHNRFTGNVCGKLRKKKYFFLPSLSQCLVQYHPWQHLTPFTYLFLTMNQNLNGCGFVQLFFVPPGQNSCLKNCFVSHSKHIAKFLPENYAVFTNILCFFSKISSSVHCSRCRGTQRPFYPTWKIFKLIVESRVIVIVFLTPLMSEFQTARHFLVFHETQNFSFDSVYQNGQNHRNVS